jgi:DNA-directed RNA polymerase specialized sigma24 family protein
LGEVLTAGLGGWLAGALVAQGPPAGDHVAGSANHDHRVTEADVRRALSGLTDVHEEAGTQNGAATAPGPDLRETLLPKLEAMTRSTVQADAEAARVVEALYVHGLTSRQVEQRFYISHATVYRRASRGIALLTAELQRAANGRVER